MELGASRAAGQARTKEALPPGHRRGLSAARDTEFPRALWNAQPRLVPTAQLEETVWALASGEHRQSGPSAKTSSLACSPRPRRAAPSCSPQLHTTTPGQTRSAQPCPQGPQNTKAHPRRGGRPFPQGAASNPGSWASLSTHSAWRATQSGCQLSPTPLSAHSPRGRSHRAV